MTGADRDHQGPPGRLPVLWGHDLVAQNAEEGQHAHPDPDGEGEDRPGQDIVPLPRLPLRGAGWIENDPQARHPWNR